MLYVSPSADAALGYDPDAIVGRSGFGYAHPDDLAMAQTAFAAALEHPGQRQTFLMRLRHADGSWLWTEQVLTNCLDNADIGGVVINARDVTARVVAENALRQSESRYRAIAETSHEGIWSVDPDGTTRYANSRMHEILGITAEDLVRRTAIELLSPEDRPFLTEKLRNRAVLGPEEYQLEYPHPDGRTRVLSLIVSPLADDAGVVGSLAMIADVTESRRTDEELRRRALHDDLTGLANRTLLTDRLEQAVARQQRLHSAPVAVLFVDLDQFKLVNDAWGYDAGDALLAQAGRRVAKAARPGDTVARFGGDEFVIVAEGLSESEARQLAECVLGELAAPFEIDGHRAYVNASIGVAVSPPASASELLRSAHGAMYDAKSRGRGRVHVFDPSLAAAGDGRLQLGSDLRDALSSDALELHYQPIVELATGRLLGVEALARWEHPVHGFVPPQKFVAVAEGIGLAGVLDRWVLGRAVRDQVRLRKAFGPDFQVSVNISARHLTELDLEQSVRDALAQAGSTAAGLVLELTESTVMDDPEQAREVLERITAMGIEIAVDDFGTGYSSLGYLSRLPVQALKIDRSFVADITRDADSLAIAAAVIDLARGLRLRTVAEGIETPEQLALLRALGCGGGQGYLWSPAVPLAQLEELVVGLPTRKFDVTAGDDAGGPTIRRDHITAEHGLTRLMALHREGASLTTIAAALNAEGFRTPRGLRWHKSTVARVVSGAAFPGLATAR
jgi:diguanylate cyclase (GGDEF)-like protein/PAS domain S-box-containing protein